MYQRDKNKIVQFYFYDPLKQPLVMHMKVR